MTPKTPHDEPLFAADARRVCAPCSKEKQIDDIWEALCGDLKDKGIKTRVVETESRVADLVLDVWGNGKPGLKAQVAAQDARLCTIEAAHKERVCSGAIMLTPKMLLIGVAAIVALSTAGPEGLKAVLKIFGIGGV